MICQNSEMREPLIHIIGIDCAVQDNRIGLASGVLNLFRRETDREIKRRLGRQPLDVGADRIARTGHRALEILSKLADSLKLREILLAWVPAPRAQLKGRCER